MLNVVAGAMTGVGVLLTVLATRAVVRYGGTRSVLVLAGFLLFLAQGLVLSWSLFVANDVLRFIVPIIACGGLGFLAIYSATLVRPSPR